MLVTVFDVTPEMNPVDWPAKFCGTVPLSGRENAATDGVTELPAGIVKFMSPSGTLATEV